MARNSFNIFNELSAWGKTLPIWQSSLLSKLISSSELTDNDIDQVFNEFLIDQGLVIHSGARIDYTLSVPQFQENIPETIPHLKMMKDVLGVNALIPGEELTFGPNLNVVYGPNGSGKSGYARVLKAACFTRSHETKILGDVRLEETKQGTPTAKFVFNNGTDTIYVYQQECPRLQDYFAVFDSTCIRVHLDERKAFQVMPYLFDVFPRMVEVIWKLQNKLKEQMASRTPAVDKFVIPNSDSTVAKILTSLTARTDLTELAKLANFGDVETLRLEEIIKKINELRGTDPKQLIKQNEQKIIDLQSLLTCLETATASINEDLINKTKQEIEKTNKLMDKSAALSAAQCGDEPVKPVGTLAWRELLTAAIKYHEEVYPGDSFPPTASDKPRCILCQQELGTEAKDRLTRFYQIATSDVETQLADSKRELNEISKKLGKVNLDFFNTESAARRMLKDLAADLEAEIAAHIVICEATKIGLIESINNLSSPTVIPPVDSVSRQLQELSKHIKKENEDLSMKDPEEIIKPLITEQKLLEDRKFLSGKYAEIAAAVEDLKWIAKASNAQKGFSGTQREITTKQKALAKNLLAQGFIECFTENCKALNLELPVKFRFAGDAGNTDRQIEIANAGCSGFEPSDVLSEGEQTATALADFLTEVELNGSCAGVIFDDPVTSMDHIRKESIAKRLVKEAATRQVIIFTHDILFTNYLANAAVENGIDFTGRTVCNTDTQEPGCVDVLAFPYEKYEGAAYDRAKKHLDEAKKLTGDMQRDQLEKACGKLRTAYEDFIQKKLFGDVVGRWRENIKFILDKVYFDEKIALRVHERMVALSRYIDAHSHTPDYQGIPLTTTLVDKELADFNQIKGDYNTAKKIWEKAKPVAKFD
ncbi:MAG TPA: AAA family ATPase [Spirochaetota bacterium]|nr:AAA family ATPase [Spirochaetota bacterium]